MTIEIILKCDGYKCSASREIEEDTDYYVEQALWGVDDRTGFHYCPKCWEEAKEEIRQEMLDEDL